jgi:hypothetical protein
MSAVAPLTGESVKSLGAGAYLVTALPSAVLVLVAVGLVTSKLYPWAEPLTRPNGDKLDPGIASVVYTVGHAGVAGAIVLTLVVLAGSVLLRPFQIVFVQVLEGYWRGGLWHRLRVARHMSRHSIAATRLHMSTTTRPASGDAEGVASYARLVRQKAALQERAIQTLNAYPEDDRHIMPTTLGNVLRRAETSAGERYGLSTTLMLPRLYPQLSAQLDRELREQVNVLDSASVFTLLFGCLTAVDAPLAWRLDWWSVAPFLTASCAWVAYRGACTAAMHVGQVWATAFDLHRFEMLAAMRQRLPRHGKEERETNSALTEAIGGQAARLEALRYVHHDQTSHPARRVP